MPENPREQANLAGDETSSKGQDSVPSALATGSLQGITEIARKLAVYGGGTASLDLAFDLVLHGIAKQARAASGATGAAIALMRDGKMVCRATTGENAPDLGVSVGAASGLTGICLNTGTVQHCLDTESDPSVDPETCRRLGVRSMLLVPLIDTNGVFGVLQLFSSSPNAFREQQMATLLRIADRVAENRMAMLQSAKAAVKSESVQARLPSQRKPERNDLEAVTNNDVLERDTPIAEAREIWTTVFFVLVIIAAISLGIVVGWSNGRKATKTPGVPLKPNVGPAGRAQVSVKSSAEITATGSTGGLGPSSTFQNETKSIAVPAGGLLVTENGKVVYRYPDQPRNPPASAAGARDLIHRVEPDYPPEARAQRVEGTVILDVEIAKDGRVTSAVAVSGDPRLALAAVQAVKQWQYEADPKGDSRARVTLQFRLPVK